MKPFIFAAIRTAASQPRRRAARRTRPLRLEQLEGRAMLAAVIPPAGLVSWYRAEADAADSAYGNHAQLVGGATVAAGKVGQAFSFDGVDDEVRAPHNLNQNPGNQITIEAWINPDTLDHGRPIAQKRSAGNVGGFTLETTHSSIPGEPANGLQFVLWLGSTPTQSRIATPAEVLTTGAWQHVAATYDGTAMKIYVSGNEVASQAASGPIADTSEPVVIGRNVVIPSFAWDGLIDEVSLYNRALSQAEIQAIVAADSDGKDASAVVFRADFDRHETVVHQSDFEGDVSPQWSSAATDVTPLGSRRFLGQFGNDAVTLTLPAASIPAGATRLALSLDLLVIRTWDGNHNGGGSGPDRWTLTAGGATLLDTTFSNDHPNSGFAGQAYPGAFGSGQFAPRTGAAENDTLGFEFPGVGVMDSVYELDFTFDYTGGDVVITFAGALTTPGDDESWGLDNVAVTAISPVPPQFSGVTGLTGVQGYSAHGLSGNFLRNDSLPPARTTLTLIDLPPHDAIDLRFLLAAIDSWDGSQQGSQFFAPDIFNVTVDGNPIFSETLVNSQSAGNVQTYVPPPDVELARRQQLGFNPDNSDFRDSAYNLGLDPVFQNIPHTASTLTVEWFAGGAGYEGGINESWGIDNVEVVLRGSGNSPPSTLQLTNTSYEVFEGQAYAVLTVERTGGLFASARVDFKTADGTANQRLIRKGVQRVDDYTTTSGTLFFKPGITTREIRVPIIDDARIEADETFQVVLSNVSEGATLGPNTTANVVIHDNDPTIFFLVAASQRGEAAAGRGQIEVRLRPASNQTVRVPYAAVGGTATMGVDFSLRGTLTFRPGETRKFIQFTALNDTLYEGDETAILELSPPTGVFLGGQSRHTVTILDNDPEPPPQEPGSTTDTALPVDLQTLPRQSLRDLIIRTSGGIMDIDTFRVQLAAGEAIVLDVDGVAAGGSEFHIPGLADSTLVVLGSDGVTPDIKELARVGRSREPESGLFTNNPALLFRAPAAGDYFFQLQSDVNGLFGYRLHFHRLGVSENVPAPELLNVSGPMFAWYEASATPGIATVGITGPTGYGFTLTGPWQQTATSTGVGLLKQTLTLPAGSQFTMASPQGVELPLLANGLVQFATTSNRFGRDVGEVMGSAINFPVSLAIAPINDLLADVFGSQIAAVGLLPGNWRISLGGKVLAVNTDRGLRNVNSQIQPLLAGVPYLRQKSPIAVTAQLGPFSFSQPVVDKPIDCAFDPADPMLYVKVDALGEVRKPALAVSMHGLLEYEPQDAPAPEVDAGVTEFFGHIFGRAIIPFKIGPLPLEVDADVVISADANRDGLLLGDLRDAHELLDVVQGDFSEVREIMHDVQVGANGVLKAIIEVQEKEYRTELGRASVVLNGLEESIWVRGQQGANNPFAGTPLEQLNAGNTIIVVEGMIDWGGDFLFSTTTTYDVGPADLSFNITIRDEGISAHVTGRAEWGVSIDTDLGSVSGKAIAELSADIEIEVDDDGDLHFSGSVSASGKLRYKGRNLFSGSIEASVRSGGFRFKFPRGVGAIDLNLL